MKVLVVAPATYDTSPGQRFRMEQWARYLERDGDRFDYAPFEDDELHELIHKPGRTARKAVLALRAFGRRLRLLRRVRDYDVVYLFREAAVVGPAVFERLVARRRVPVVYDFDDAVWTPYVSPANSYLSYLKFFGKTATLCRISSLVMAGNEYLADYARRYNPRVEIVPTTIDTEAYRVRPYLEPADAGPLTVGWTGSYSTVQHLDTIRPALQKLRQLVPFRLVVVGTPNYQLDGVEVEAKAWKSATEISDLQTFDIGLMPLPDDDWSKGKCGLKLLQCMGVGVPVVGSPVGVNRDIIREGVNGFTAATHDDWVEKLLALARDATLRRTMGLNGRRTVEEEYSAGTWAPRVRALLESVRRDPGAKLAGPRVTVPA